MSEKKVIIIGAGLAAGIYARMNGYQAQIFEHANQPGGVSVAYRRNDYTIDAGIHLKVRIFLLPWRNLRICLTSGIPAG